jgi:glycosyltransferase involved in cell wall biosynthesis
MNSLEDKQSIDIIIPVFNGSRTISRAIMSIQSQSYAGRISIYAVDDCSTDDSIKILENLKSENENFFIKKNSQNIGNAASRNIGYKLGSASLVAFLDQDDVWRSDKLSLQVKAITDDPELGYLVGMQEFKLLDSNNVPGWFNIEWSKAAQPGFVPSTLIIRRSILNLVGEFSEDMRIGSDVDWFARARRMGIPYKLLPEVLVDREIHSNNLSANTGSNIEYLRMLKIHLDAKNEH